MIKSRGSILVGLLWCVALLSVLVVGVLHTSRLDLMVVKNHGDAIQAHYLALAGIEKTKALLYQESVQRKGSRLNHTGKLYDSPENFRAVKFGRGEFSVFRAGAPEEGGKIIYGVTDEESRLNVNHATAQELIKLYGMTPEVVASIIDWRDPDSNTTENGAEQDYYSSLQPPYIPRNGPLQTIRELLSVKGVTRQLLFGEDANMNGLLDLEENDGQENYPPDNHDGILDAGWSTFLTVDSMSGNRNAAGDERVNIQSGDESSLSNIKGLSSEQAKAIVAYRNQNKLEALSDLLDVTAMQPQGTRPGSPLPGQPGAPQQGSPNPVQPSPPSQPVQANQPAPSPQPSAPCQPNPGNPQNAVSVGPKLISQDLLMEIADDLTSGQEAEHGAVNVNTASSTVLACLPGMNEELAQAVVSYRKSSGYFQNTAMLLKVPGFNQQILKQLGPRVTTRSETFRILAEGRIGSTGVRKRIQVTIHMGSTRMQTISYREDL